MILVVERHAFLTRCTRAVATTARDAKAKRLKAAEADEIINDRS